MPSSRIIGACVWIALFSHNELFLQYEFDCSAVCSTSAEYELPEPLPIRSIGVDNCVCTKYFQSILILRIFCSLELQLVLLQWNMNCLGHFLAHSLSTTCVCKAVFAHSAVSHLFALL